MESHIVSQLVENCGKIGWKIKLGAALNTVARDSKLGKIATFLIVFQFCLNASKIDPEKKVVIVIKYDDPRIVLMKKRKEAAEDFGLFFTDFVQKSCTYLTNRGNEASKKNFSILLCIENE